MNTTAVAIFVNPATQKKQKVNTQNGALKTLGFDEAGKVVYQEAVIDGVFHMAGFLPDAKHFVHFQ